LAAAGGFAMSREPIPQEVALKLQCVAIAGHEPPSSFFELRPLDPAGGQEFIPVCDVSAVIGRVEQLRDRHQVYIGAAPRTREAGTADAIERVWTLWGDCDTEEAVEQLRGFRPLPSIVVKSGTKGHLHAWWPLRHSITPRWAERANKRLAHRLQADPASTDVARIMRPIISVNRKTEPATMVECVRLEAVVFELRDVVAGLPDPVRCSGVVAPAIVQRPVGDPSTTLAGLARVVREARAPTANSPGERNVKLNWAAFRAGEHIASGELSEAHAEGELLAAALEVGLCEADALRTIRSGLEATRRAA
jgi:hypothetical protein